MCYWLFVLPVNCVINADDNHPLFLFCVYLFHAEYFIFVNICCLLLQYGCILFSKRIVYSDMYNIDFFQTLMLFQTMLLFINEIELHFGLFLKVTIYKRDNGGY